MAMLSQASHQWATRPADERFTSLTDMAGHFATIRSQSREVVVSTRRIQAVPTADNKGLEIVGPSGHGYAPTHWAFGQTSQLAEAPAGYLRTLPSPIAADCINYGLHHKRDIEEVGLLLHKNGDSSLRAATGPKYGRIWNSDVVDGLVRLFGNGIDGDWRVPGEFGKAVEVNKDNTTLYASDRDMFVFLADERNKIEVPNRRNGKTGLLSRGFFTWNSEVGSSTYGICAFFFDFACANRNVWGAEEIGTVKIRHTASAPDRYLEEMMPALTSYSNSSSRTLLKAIDDARAKRIDDVDTFLATRFGKRMVEPLKALHMVEEEHPIETLWDASNAVTAYARSIKYQDERVDMERKAGDILKLAA